MSRYEDPAFPPMWDNPEGHLSISKPHELCDRSSQSTPWCVSSRPLPIPACFGDDTNCKSAFAVGIDVAKSPSIRVIWMTFLVDVRGFSMTCEFCSPACRECFPGSEPGACLTSQESIMRSSSCSTHLYFTFTRVWHISAELGPAEPCLLWSTKPCFVNAILQDLFVWHSLPWPQTFCFVLFVKVYRSPWRPFSF